MLTPHETMIVNLRVAKDLYEVGMLDADNYIRTVNNILEQE